MLGVANSYTMEASFGGSELGSRMSTHFSPQDYESIGRTFCETLLDFYDEEPSKERLRNKIVTRLLKEGSNADEPTNIDLSDYSSDEGDTSSSSSEAAVKEKRECIQTAPPPSPIFAEIRRSYCDKPRKARPKLERVKRIEKKSKRETLQVSTATIDLTSDAMTDQSSDESCAENVSPLRRPQKLLHLSGNPIVRRKKKMPPELKIIPAPQTSDSPYHSDKEKKTSKCRRSRSVSMINETSEKPRLNPASWHQFRRLPPPKVLSDTKSRNSQPSELQVKLNSLKKNVWTGIQGDDKGPLSWGISSFAMNSYFTDSEALLRSCSKKLEELEEIDGKKSKYKEEKKKKKSKGKNKLTLKVPLEDITEPIRKSSWKKKGKLKHAKSESSTYINNTSFTDIPRKTNSQKTSPKENRKAKSLFRKTAFVTTAIQKKTFKAGPSDESDLDDTTGLIRKVKRKNKMMKTKLHKTTSESKGKT